MGFFVVSWHSEIISPRPQDVLLVSLCLHKHVCLVQGDVVGRLFFGDLQFAESICDLLFF